VVSTRWELSLDQPVGDDPDGRLGDLVAEPQAGEEPEDLLALPGLVARLPELEREVILLRFFQELDQDTIAARVGFPSCTSRGCNDGPWPACTPSSSNPDRLKEIAVQVLWMLTITLVLALSGVLGLAVVTHAAARTRRR
jgi:hypothetical protein